jgi:hypothetical protein
LTKACLDFNRSLAPRQITSVPNHWGSLCPARIISRARKYDSLESMRHQVSSKAFKQNPLTASMPKLHPTSPVSGHHSGRGKNLRPSTGRDSAFIDSKLRWSQSTGKLSSNQYSKCCWTSWQRFFCCKATVFSGARKCRLHALQASARGGDRGQARFNICLNVSQFVLFTHFRCA